MKRTLRSMVAVPLIAASLLLPSCIKKKENAYAKALTEYEKSLEAYQEALKVVQDSGLAYDENTINDIEDALNGMEVIIKEKDLPATSEPKVTQKSLPRGLENYFFQGDELRYIKLSKNNIEGFDKNPGITYTKNPERKRQEWEDSESLESLKILSTGSAQYILPQVEEYSETKRLLLGFVGFETAQDMNNFLEKKREELTYPLFVGKELISFIAIEPTMDDITTLSQKQKLIYISLIFDYSKRTGMKPVLSKFESESNILLEIYKRYQEDQYKIE